MNWKQVIADIQREHKLTQGRIAAEVGCGQVTISELASGKTEQPRYNLGAALLDLLKSGPKMAASAAQAATENVAEQSA
ncbi:hypothetical protein MCEMIEM13_01503 [Comamonadaceae bacterium]